ncbi:MAG: hypothetical protein JG759_765, partial [Thermoanaerobacter sp.]|nr:hypothetical protein [Thermoanaerobacter sp.]
ETIPFEEILKEDGLTKEELKKYIDMVEIE